MTPFVVSTVWSFVLFKFGSRMSTPVADARMGTGDSLNVDIKDCCDFCTKPEQFSVSLTAYLFITCTSSQSAL